MAGPTFDIRQVGRDEDDVWSAIEVILREAFPAGEYRPIEEFRHLFYEGEHPTELDQPNVFGYFVDGELLAFACTELFAAEQVCYLWYMATRVGRRGEGIGTALLGHVQSIITAHSAEGTSLAVGLVAECEAPETPDPQSLEMRRIRFYQACGFRVERVDFMAPPFARGDREPTPYRILTWTVPGIDPVVDVAAVIDWICMESVLNVPSPVAVDCARFSVATIGDEPQLAPKMRADWQAFIDGRS